MVTKKWLINANVARISRVVVIRPLDNYMYETNKTATTIKGSIVRLVKVVGNNVLVRSDFMANDNVIMFWIHQDYLTLP